MSFVCILTDCYFRVLDLIKKTKKLKMSSHNPAEIDVKPDYEEYRHSGLEMLPALPLRMIFKVSFVIHAIQIYSEVKRDVKRG